MWLSKFTIVACLWLSIHELPKASLFDSQFLRAQQLSAAIKSISGQALNFDAGNDGRIDAHLSTSGFLGLGTQQPTSNLDIVGSTGIRAQSVSSNTLLSGNTLILADSSAGNLELTLPQAQSLSHRIYNIKKTSALHEVHLLSSGADHIDGIYRSIVLKQESSSPHHRPSITLHSDGQSWRILQHSMNSTPTGHRLLADYPLDQLGGNTVVIDTVGGQHGSTDATWDTTGNTAILFNGSNSVNLGQPSALKFSPHQDPFSISVWFNLNGQSSATLVACAGSELNQRRYHLYIFNGDVSARVGGASIAHQTKVNDSQWHHMVLCNQLESGVMKFKIYLDGVVSSTSGISGSNVPGQALDILFGARRSVATDQNSGISFSFANKIDKVRFYNYGMSANDVAQLYQSQR